MTRFPRVAFALVASLSLLLAACGADSAPAVTTAPTAAPTAAAAAAAATTAPTVVVGSSVASVGASPAPLGSTAAPATAAITTAAPAPLPTVAATAAATTVPTVPTTAAAAMVAAPAGTVTGGGSGTLTVFAAASLTESFAQVKTNFERANPGVRVEYSFAGSQALVAQLTQGARADVFASADQPSMDNAVKADVVTGTPSTFVRNKLVLILPKDNRAGIRTVQDLAKPGVKFVTAQETVPVGRYTLQALDNYGKLPEYGADFRARVQRNIVSQEDNVKAIVQKVQLGEADAGVVYATDVQAARDRLTVIEIADAQNIIATYPVAVIKDARQAALAQRFVDYLLANEGQTLLGTYGFAPAK